MRCKNCKKTHINSAKSFTWIEERLCPKCYELVKDVERIKLLKEHNRYDLVYVSKNLQVLSFTRKR